MTNAVNRPTNGKRPSMLLWPLRKSWVLWRRIAALPHSWIQSRLCGDCYIIIPVYYTKKVSQTFYFMRRQGAFLPHKRLSFIRGKSPHKRL